MSDAWIFRQPHQWTRADTPPWAEEGDVAEYLATLGYVPHSRARHSDLVEFVGSWTLYTATGLDAPYAHALLVDGARDLGVLVWLPTFPDLLAYMAHYGQVGQYDWEREDWDELMGAVRMAFQAWHGHSTDRRCAECDPAQTQRWHRAQARRRQGKAGGG